jgi:hypothetical protein
MEHTITCESWIYNIGVMHVVSAVCLLNYPIPHFEKRTCHNLMLHVSALALNTSSTMRSSVALHSWPTK